jgi:GT2 family glycosyltransferase
MTDTAPAASVVICVYNRPAQVVHCLNSLLGMGCQDFEIVVVDDGSTDETPARLDEFKGAHPGRAITLVRQARNGGLSAARNAGVRAARGEFVLFTDSDCVADPGWLGAMLEEFKSPDVAAVLGWVVDAPPRNWAERAYAVSPRVRPEQWRRRVLAGNNMAFRRDVLALYPFDEAMAYYCDETDLARRLLADGRRTAFARAAVVRHDHPMTVRKFLRLGFLQGQGSARFWFKFGPYLGPDLWPMTGAVLTMPLGLLHPALLLVPLVGLLGQAAVIAKQEVALKGKGPGEAALVLPLCAAHYCCRWWGVLTTYARLALGGERAIVDSKRAWKLRQRSPSPRGAPPL